MKNKISVIIPHASQTENLAVILMLLQQQTILPASIVILDSSTALTGYKVAKRFSIKNIDIYVQAKKQSIYKNWNDGIKIALEKNPDTHFFIINDDILLPLNTIEILQNNIESKDLAIVGETPSKNHYSEVVDMPFSFYADKIIPVKTNWLCGFAFLLTNFCVKKIGYFNTAYQVWYGDDDYQKRILEVGTIKKLQGLFIYHYGGKSYDYLSPEVKSLIDKDRLLWLTSQK